MKKYLIFMALLFVSFSFVGCGNREIEALMSEQTEIYFYGENNGNWCSISVGQRENSYIIDGVHTQNTAFSLVVFQPSSAIEGNVIEVELKVDEKEEKATLELNPLNMTYMADLGYALDENSAISLSFQGEEIVFENLSQNFEVDYKEAIRVGFEKVSEEQDFYQNGVLSAEGYLKILDGSLFGGEGLYWCFSLIGKEEVSKNVLINVNDGQDIFLG